MFMRGFERFLGGHGLEVRIDRYRPLPEHLPAGRDRAPRRRRRPRAVRAVLRDRRRGHRSGARRARGAGRARRARQHRRADQRAGPQPRAARPLAGQARLRLSVRGRLRPEGPAGGRHRRQDARPRRLRRRPDAEPRLGRRARRPARRHASRWSPTSACAPSPSPPPTATRASTTGTSSARRSRRRSGSEPHRKSIDALRLALALRGRKSRTVISSKSD